MKDMDADWLARDMAEAPSDLALALSPQVAGRALAGVPLAAEDAARLRVKMVERYRQWCGRDLAADLAADAAAGEGTAP